MDETSIRDATENQLKTSDLSPSSPMSPYTGASAYALEILINIDRNTANPRMSVREISQFLLSGTVDIAKFLI